jgi:hypothetical protein
VLLKRKVITADASCLATQLRTGKLFYHLAYFVCRLSFAR